IARAGPVLARATVELSRQDPPSAQPLAMLPAEALNVATVRAYADTVDVRTYRRMSDIGIGGFDVSIQTPFQTCVAMRLYEEDIGKDRKKREALSGLPESQRYSEVRELR